MHEGSDVATEEQMEKFDENYLSIDERLKYAVKRCYFSNKNEVDYDKINYQIL